MANNSTNKKTPNRPVTSRGQQTRQRILEAAEELFGQRGYDQTGIVDICQSAGVAQGTFYVYFTDKKAILVELIKQLSHTLRKEIAEAVRGLSDRAEAERVGFHTFFRFVTRHRNLYRVVRQAEYVDEETFRWYYHRLAQGYMRGLSQAMSAEQIRTLDVESLAYCLMGIGDFVGMRWVLWENKPPPDEAFESIISFIMHGLSPRSDKQG